MCPAKKEISALADNELPGKKAGKINEHLKICGACAKAYKNYSSLSIDMPLLSSVEIARRESSCWQKIQSRLMHRKNGRFSELRLPLPAFAMIMVFLVSGSAVFTFNLTRTRVQAPVTSTMDVPLFNNLEELIVFLDTYHSVKTIRMNLPEESRFMVASKPLLIHEEEYRQSQW